jgi:hypothetical protein
VKALQAFGDYWLWWRSARDRIARAIEDGTVEGLVSEISARVDAIHPGLAWELAPGARSSHAFVVSAEGNMQLRALGEAWLQAAPGPDATWEYYAARQPASIEIELNVSGQTFKLDDATAIYTLDEDRQRLDVELFHPGFTGRDEHQRAIVGFLLMDQLLGEDGVERWLGEISWQAQQPLGAKPIVELRRAVEQLAAQPNRERFGLLRGSNASGLPSIVGLNLALKHIDHLGYDTHVWVIVSFQSANSYGMPKSADVPLLDELEDEILATAGPEAVLIGHATGGGRRTVHMYVRDALRVRAWLDRWRLAHPDWLIDIGSNVDPNWDYYASGINTDNFARQS